ncbi:MAG: hypothetical protein HY217_03435 [Candidatus Rokubacteria bacterium]|nr:hypothetical protein [Candidatus Rokubacteria bacterium]
MRSVSGRARAIALLTALMTLVPVLVSTTAAQGRREVRVGVAGVPGALDPANALRGAVPLIARQVFETLVVSREGSTDTSRSTMAPR